MKFLNHMSNSFGCSASGERLVSAARDGDLQEAKALLEYNPQLAKYSTFGVRNSPLHYSAAQGHHEIVSLLIESGVDINSRNCRGQTALMQACQYGHWEVVLTLILCKANLLIGRGGSLTTENANGWTPLMVARSWHKELLEEILSKMPEGQPRVHISTYLCLPMMSIVDIARECRWKSSDFELAYADPCVVCLERKCTVAAEGCFHEFCTHCALYLCSTNYTSNIAHCPRGSIPCPLCRHGIVSFVKLEGTRPLVKEIGRTSLSLPFCSCSADAPALASLETPYCKPASQCAQTSPLSSSFRSLSCQKFPSFSPAICMGSSDTRPSLVSRTVDHDTRDQSVRCLRSFRRSSPQTEGRRWLCSFNHSLETGSGC